MDAYIINQEAHGALVAWNDCGEGSRIAKTFHKPYFYRCRVVFEETNLVANVKTRHDNKIRINITDNKEQIIKILADPDDENNDYGLRFEITNAELNNLYKADGEERTHINDIITIVVRTYLMINAFMFFGNLVESKKIDVRGKNTKQGKIIVFRAPKEGTLTAVRVGNHRSPEGVFSVRGHLRHYRDGKVVWIDEYFKGLKKETINDN